MEESIFSSVKSYRNIIITPQSGETKPGISEWFLVFHGVLCATLCGSASDSKTQVRAPTVNILQVNGDPKVVYSPF